MKLLITGCVHCGAYSPAIDGVCDACRAARDATARRAPRDRRVRIRKPTR